MPIFDLKNAYVSLVDGTSGTANSLLIKIGEGTLTWSEKVNRKFFLDRGIIDEVRNEDQVPMEVHIEAVWQYLKADTGQPVTIEDVLKQRGTASTWVSTNPDACQPYCVDVHVYYEVACATIKDESIVLPQFYYESINHDAKAGHLSLSGKCNATQSTSTRIAQSSRPVFGADGG